MKAVHQTPFVGEVLSSATIPCDSVSMEMYKCDFCPFQSESLKDTKIHLYSKGHYCANLYRALKFEDGKIELVAVKEIVPAINEHAYLKNILVTCASCKFPYGDIYMCKMHCKETHVNKVNDNIYCLSRQIAEKKTNLSVQGFYCTECFADFDCAKALHEHVRASEHIYAAPDEGQFDLFLCPYCHLIYYKLFFGFWMHVRQGHTHGKSTEITITMRTFEISTEEMISLPIDYGEKSQAQDQLSGEVEQLKRLEVHAHTLITYSRKCTQKRLTKTINNTKKLRNELIIYDWKI